MWRGQICTQRAPVVSRTRQADVWVRTFGCNLNQFRKTKMNISSENSAKSWQEQGCNWASGNLQAPPGFSLSLCLSAYISHLHLHLPSPTLISISISHLLSMSISHLHLHVHFRLHLSSMAVWVLVSFYYCTMASFTQRKMASNIFQVFHRTTSTSFSSVSVLKKTHQ